MGHTVPSSRRDHISHQLVLATEAHASGGVVRWRELYQYRAAPRVVLWTPWLDPDCRLLSRSVTAEKSVRECLRECIDGGTGRGHGKRPDRGAGAEISSSFPLRNRAAASYTASCGCELRSGQRFVRTASRDKSRLGIAERRKSQGVVCVVWESRSVFSMENFS